MHHSFVLSAVLLLTLWVPGCGPKKTQVAEVSPASSVDLSDVSPFQTADSDWPMWRGADRNNFAKTSGAPLSWSESENVVWKTPIPGRGHGSATVVGDRVFVATADEKQQSQSVIALDRATGDQLWAKEVGRGGFPSKMHPKSTHANGTLACDGEFVFGAFLNHDSIHVVALTVEGETAWTQKVGAFASKFGYAPSPTIYGPLVIIAADNFGGGYLAGLNRSTGEVIWRRARGDASSYSSPIIGRVGGKDQLLISGNDQLASYDPMTGKELWSIPAIAEATCGTVVFDDTHVFASGGYPDKQTICVDASGSPKEVWSNRKKLYEPSMLLVGDNLYAVTDDGIAYCWEAKTGSEAWKKRLGGGFSASPILVGDQVLVMSDNGSCIVFKATREGYQEAGRNQLGDSAFATPTVCADAIYIRTASGSGPQRQEYLYKIGKE